MRRSILMLLQSDFPPDIRVEKEIKALANDGYSIAILSNNKKNRPLLEPAKGAEIYRLKTHPFWGKSIGQKFNLPVPINPFWIFPFLRLGKRKKPFAIHVHDLPFGLFGIIGKLIFNAKFVLDLHENYPAALALWGQKGGFFSRIFRNARLAEAYEKICCRFADQIIVVASAHQQFLEKKYRLNNKIKVVGNTVEWGTYEKFPLDPEILTQYAHHFVVTFLGQLSPERDLDIALQAIPYLRERIHGIKLLIIGDGPIRHQLEKQIEEQNLTENVELVGWVPFEKTSSYLAASHICIIPQGSNDLIDNGTPHKLFQYMAMGKPVVVSDARAMRQVVEETKCGEVFQSKSPKDFARAILKIKNNPDFPYGENGIRAVQEKYNWDRDAQTLRRLYDELLST